MCWFKISEMKLMFRWFMSALCLCAMSEASHAQETELDRYVAQPDPSYRWKIVRTRRQDNLTTFVVDMTSQAWRHPSEVDRTRWQHFLIVTRPDQLAGETGLLFISGGRNGQDVPEGPDDRMAQIAKASKSVVATLLMVPNQPLEFRQDGHARFEDDLVAYTWKQYFETGDPNWPARNPMVKSAVRAMDTVTAVMATDEGGEATVNKFVVAGASKRGWTTWLTAAVDQRVVAIIPIVIDVLNLEPTMRHHYAAYGFWAPAVGDYVEQRIFEYMGTDKMNKLVELVDPYSYRERLNMPKFLLNAAGDQFFLPDSSQFYFDALQGEKYLRYVPNADHSLDGSDAVESLLAFYLSVLHNQPRPQIEWSFEQDKAIRVSTSMAPSQVLLWQATNPEARDFRVETLGRKYRSSDLAPRDDGNYLARVKPPEKGWTAFFVELTYRGVGPVPLKLTTSVRVVPDELPFADEDPRGQ